MEELKQRVAHIESKEDTILADVTSLKVDLAAIKSDASHVKADVAAVRSDIHRLMWAVISGIGGVVVAVVAGLILATLAHK